MRLNRSDLRDVVIGIGIFFLFWFAANSVAKSTVGNLKQEINQTLQTECEANAEAPIFAKYNSLAKGLVQQQLTALKLNSAKGGDPAKAAADAKYAAIFENAEIQTITANCSIAFLK